MEAVSRKAALAALVMVMKDQETKNPALAAKQKRLIAILQQRQVRSTGVDGALHLTNRRSK